MNFNIPIEYRKDNPSRTPFDQMEGGYTRHEIDRSVRIIQGEFYRSYGDGVIQHAQKVHEQDGYLSILDAGCGTGYELFELCEQVENLPRVRAVGVSDIDFSGESEMWQVRAAAQNGEIGYVVADLQTEPMPAKSFNFIISYEVLMHCDDPGSVVQNLADGLTNGGVLLCNADKGQANAIVAALKTLGENYSYERRTAVRDLASVFAEEDPQSRDNYRVIRK